MSTSIRVSDHTKALLEQLKREDETFDELLDRLAESELPINVGAWSDQQADRARVRSDVPGELRPVTFLDSSVIIDMLAGGPDVVEYVADRGQPYSTSSLCVFEVIEGEVGAGGTDVVSVRQEFGGVHSLDLTEQIALAAARMQDRLMDDGERLASRDLRIAATARSAGDELIVADGDFQTQLLADLMYVTNLDDD